MRQHTMKRVGLFVPTVLLVTVLVFVLMRWIPGDPALAILEDEGVGSFTQEDLARLRQEIGTDRPIVVQYVTWMSGVVQGDFGDSPWFNAPVMGELKDRIPVTVELAIFAMLLAMVVAIPLGVVQRDGYLHRAEHHHPRVRHRRRGFIELLWCGYTTGRCLLGRAAEPVRHNLY